MRSRNKVKTDKKMSFAYLGDIGFSFYYGESYSLVFGNVESFRRSSGYEEPEMELFRALDGLSAHQTQLADLGAIPLERRMLELSRFSLLQCYISLSMSIGSVYRRTPEYLAVPLALMASVLFALALATIGAYTFDLLLGKIHGPGDLGDAMLAFFDVAPSIAVLAFVVCFSFLVNWHHKTSWRTPTFAFLLVGILVWVWPFDFGGGSYVWYIPGTPAWLVSCWLCAGT
jgi:hypothetical protein